MTVKVDCINSNTSFGNHPSCYGTINAAAEQQSGFAIGSDGHSAGAAVFLEPRAAGLTKGAGVGYNSCKAGAEAPDTRPEGRRLHPSRLATKASPSPRDGLCASRFFVLGENAPMPCAHTARHKAARGPVLAYSLRLTCRFVSPGRPRAPQCPRGASVPAACTGRHAEFCAAEREFARKRIFGRQGQSGAGRRPGPASLSRALQTHK